MRIELRRSNFSQFSRDLWFRAYADGTTIDFDICEKEILGFSLNMLDVADDCMRQAIRNGDERIDDIRGSIVNIINQIDNLEKNANKKENNEPQS